MRWSVDFLKPPEDMIYGYPDSAANSILDIYHKSFQERFEFFLDHPEESFAMFNDMIDTYSVFGEFMLEEAGLLEDSQDDEDETDGAM